MREKCVLMRTDGRGNAVCGGMTQKCTPRCRFYKTEDEAAIERQKCITRLHSLDIKTRIYIAEKYGVRGIV